MLRRAASLLPGRAAWLSRLPRRPVTPAATLLRRHPETRVGPLAPLPHLGDVAARGYARMARRIPPVRPDGYSTSDGEADKPDAYGEEDLAGADGEEGAAEGKEWEGYMLDFGSGSDEEEEDEEEEGEKK